MFYLLNKALFLLYHLIPFSPRKKSKYCLKFEEESILSFSIIYGRVFSWILSICWYSAKINLRATLFSTYTFSAVTNSTHAQFSLASLFSTWAFAFVFCSAHGHFQWCSILLNFIFWSLSWKSTPRPNTSFCLVNGKQFSVELK